MLIARLVRPRGVLQDVADREVVHREQDAPVRDGGHVVAVEGRGSAHGSTRVAVAVEVMVPTWTPTLTTCLHSVR